MQGHVLTYDISCNILRTAFFAFTLYIGTVWKDAFAVEKNFNRYYAISTGCRIINICGAFWSMYGKTSVSGWVRR